MADYTKFRIQSYTDNQMHRVLVKCWWGWGTGHRNTNFFDSFYVSRKLAEEAVYNYMNRNLDIS